MLENMSRYAQKEVTMLMMLQLDINLRHYFLFRHNKDSLQHVITVYYNTLQLYDQWVTKISRRANTSVVRDLSLWILFSVDKL